MITATELKKEFDLYNQGENTERSWTMTPLMITGYSNQYISVVRMDSSNNWLGEPHKSPMTKMWSIIVDIKKDFRFLPTKRY